MEEAPTPRESSDGITPEQWEMYEAYMAENPDVEIPPEMLVDCGPEIIKLESLCTSFETAHSLEALNAITDLQPSEAPKHPIREPARIALNPIFSQLKLLKKITNVTPDVLHMIEERCDLISRAVGMINQNKVDHSRRRPS